MPAKKKDARKMRVPEFQGRFKRLHDHFKGKPDSALRALYADVERLEGLHSYARSEKFVIEADEPEGIGGTDKAATPTQVFLASLAHCQAITLKIYAEGLGIVLDDVKVKVTGVFDLRGYYSIEGEDGPVDPAVQEIKVVTFIMSKAPPASIRTLIGAVAGRGVCLATVEKAVKVRYSYRLNGVPLKSQ